MVCAGSGAEMEPLGGILPPSEDACEIWKRIERREDTLRGTNTYEEFANAFCFVDNG
jgi:hypothetical protein